MTTKKSSPGARSIRIGLVVPHIFMHREILPGVIFSPGTLALDLANGLTDLGAEVTLFSPGPVDIKAKNMTADLSYFEKELAGRRDTYIDLLKKHPLTFITLARQVQSEIIARAFAAANNDELDIVHIYTNEEDIALPFTKFCKKPVVFTHHDSFNFLVKYKNIFPKYKQLHWLSISDSQRKSMPKDTNWLKTIYHGIDEKAWQPHLGPSDNYVAYFGRIIEPKGVHLAIAAIKKYNEISDLPLKLKIAGKHYAEHTKDTYWRTKIEPELGENIEYVGFISNVAEKNAFLGNARALLTPSTWQEPFGMVMIEALASATPIIALDSGSVSEIVRPHETGFVIKPAFSIDSKGQKVMNEALAVNDLAKALQSINHIDRQICRKEFEKRFTLKRMARDHLAVYKSLIR